MIPFSQTIAGLLVKYKPQVSTGDMVLIAGKGHEVTQTIGSRVLPFDDREQARAVLSQLVAGTETS